MRNRYKIVSYKPEDKMSELICENYPMMLVLSRFGLKLGFKDGTISRVCRDQGIDTNTLLAVVNLLLAERKAGINAAEISLPTLIEYLRRSHRYFVEYKLPEIGSHLKAAIPQSEALFSAVMSYYDEYVAEVVNHMQFEEQSVFKYVESLAAGECRDDFHIGLFRDNHQSMDSKLSELKSIIIKYYPAEATHELSDALFEIFACEEDLLSHSDIEDYLLIPAIQHLEQQNLK